MMAVFKKHSEIAETLLAGGADPNRTAISSEQLSGGAGVAGAANRVGPYSPLQIAVARIDVSMARLLFKFKANANINYWYGDPPNPLIFVTVGQGEMLKAFLDGGANPDSVTTSDEPVINVAARQGFAPTEVLLAHRAKVNVHGEADVTPLHRAVEGGDRMTLELLLEHQAHANAKDTQGATPLHWAVNYGRKDLIEVLLAHGADPNIQNNEGRTPLDLTKAQQPGLPGPPGGVRAVRPLRTIASAPESKASPAQIAEVLRAKGALDELPNFSGIRITRGMATPQIVFPKGTNSLNRFTLMEALVSVYSQQPGTVFSPVSPRITMPFPDLKKIRIQRWSGGKPSDKKEIAVNFLTDAGSIDCAKDVPLEFGDVIEIPEREHTLAEPSVGLTAEQYNALAKCTERKVKVVVRSETAEIRIAGENAYLSQALAYREVQNVLRSTSDFSRIKVTRADPTTKQAKQFVVPKVSGPDDLWLRDGDVIEVPDKE
jgi:ankyrin repeat protein